MKKLIISVLALLLAVPVFGQAGTGDYLWPIEGAKAGAGIIYTPQSYIDGELNFGNLFIAAPEGTVVVSPCDGTVHSISIGYSRSLSYSNSFGYDTSLSFDEALPHIRGEVGRSFDSKYVSGHISIRAADGNVIWIGGLAGDQVFKTGQKIRRGEPIGRVAYSYQKIAEPSIDLSVSRNSKSADPMSPFGLKSTFIPPGEIKPITSLTKEQAKEDFLLYIDILREAYPGLYNVVTEAELEEYAENTVERIDSGEGDISYDDFRYIINGAVAKIHDSHIYLHAPAWQNQNKLPDYQPAVWFGFLEGRFVATLATGEYEELIGKEVSRLNGIPADSALSIIYSQTTSYDSKVEGYKDYRAATMGFGTLFRGRPDFSAEVEFADGGKSEIKGYSTKRGMPKYLNDFGDFMRLNWRPELTEMKMLNDSTAYLGLSSFSLTQVHVDEVGEFIDSIAGVPHLIIDVRNNGGGQVEPLYRLYSYIAGEPMRLDGYSRVNKKGNFAAAAHSMNYVGVTDDIFPYYEPEEGKEGFYQRPEWENTVMADSTTNYKGRVYVLANENSISAATLFPALLVRNHRGVVVGRETRTAYHFMNAIKFMDISLPNSKIAITIPLVETYFDTVVNERVPFGRGVIPDYTVPLTLDELTYRDGDAILNHTLKLIADGEYIKGDDPFAQTPEEARAGKYGNLLIIGVAVILAAVALVIALLRKRKKSGQKG